MEWINPCKAATANGNITIINFSMGSAMAATIMDLLTAISSKSCFVFRKMWWIKERKMKLEI
jgi:AMP nucleosidase